MIKKYLLLPTFVLVLAMTLVACGGSPVANTDSTAETVASSQATTEATITEQATTEAKAIQLPAPNLSPIGPVQVVCTPVDIPENKAIAAVSNTDWSDGTADAPVTFIEYGDFQ